MTRRWHNLIGTPDWLPVHQIQEHFSAEVRVALRHSSNYACDREWSNAMLQTPLELTVARAGESSWHWARTHANWEHLRRCTQFLSRLQFLDRDGQADARLTTRLEFTRSSIGSRGRARFTPGLYIDANMALLLDWEGVHAATISFAWTAADRGDEPILRIRQIQLAQPKGNRWAYRLGDCYFTALLASLTRAARGLARVQVIRGEALAKSYAADYREQRRRMESYRRQWTDADRREHAAFADKIHHYETEIGPRLARLYAQVPDNYSARGRTDGYRELVAA